MTHINYLMENTKNPVIEKKRYELHNDKNNSYFIFIINYNEMHFNESLYTLINMIPIARISFFSKDFLRIRFFDIEIKRSSEGYSIMNSNKKKYLQYSRISYKYRFSLEFNHQLRNKRKVKLFNLFFFFNTSMLGLVTSSNLIQIYFFWDLGFWSFRDLFKIANNWIPNNGINSLLTTFFISLIGTITLFLGATLALAQRDIKRSLAYSTMSQLGYMMLALGIGSYQAALFHLITHAYSKALLFLGSGSLVVFTLFWNNSLFYCRINCILYVSEYIYLLFDGYLRKVRCIQYPYGEKSGVSFFSQNIPKIPANTRNKIGSLIIEYWS
ncbi:hypothetical protein ACJX0J_002173 [Zea mays]